MNQAGANKPSTARTKREWKGGPITLTPRQKRSLSKGVELTQLLSTESWDDIAKWSPDCPADVDEALRDAWTTERVFKEQHRSYSTSREYLRSGAFLHWKAYSRKNSNPLTPMITKALL